MTPQPNRLRRHLLLGAAAGLVATGHEANALPPKTLGFPRDRGSHPDFKTEWWYVTGYVKSGARAFGFQLTFFRSRVDSTQAMLSNFAARQLIFSHAAITDVDGKKLWHDQRIARAGFGVASTSETDMAIKLRDWSLLADRQRYTAQLSASDFGLNLQFLETQAVLLQGQQGLSRKGPDEKQASYYYSQPHLSVSGSLRVQGKIFGVTGTAWLDHEWSQELLAPGVVGWDWIGMNLADSSALMAFRLRDKDGNAVWSGGSFRSLASGLQIFKPDEIVFKPTRFWKSPLSQTTYPVQWSVSTPAGSYIVKAVVDNQELDSRQSTGAIYWEGLSELADSQGKNVGMGYLEMTGYSEPLRM